MQRGGRSDNRINIESIVLNSVRGTPLMAFFLRAGRESIDLHPIQNSLSIYR